MVGCGETGAGNVVRFVKIYKIFMSGESTVASRMGNFHVVTAPVEGYENSDSKDVPMESYIWLNKNKIPVKENCGALKGSFGVAPEYEHLLDSRRRFFYPKGQIVDVTI